MYRMLVDCMRLMAAWPVGRALVTRDLRRSISRFVIRRERAHMVRRAFAGRMANVDDIAAFVIAHPIRLRAPLILISQVQRSGGTLLSQLLDGHCAIAAHPQELKIGYPTEREWPPLDPVLGPDRNFRMVYEMNNIMLMKRGYTKGDHNPDRRPFFLVPRVQQSLFHCLFETAPPANRREIFDHFFTAYFNAWLNYQGDLEAKRWVSAFWPRLAHYEAAVSGFFESYPDGRLIQVIRDPKTWYPSAKSNKKSGLADKTPEEILSAWCASANSMLRNSAAYGEKVILLRFEDLVGDTERTMRMLARELGIAYDPILSEPTFNGKSMRANSSFAVQNSGVIDDPLSRENILTQEERRLIEECCGELYQRVLDECSSAREGEARSRGLAIAPPERVTLPHLVIVAAASGAGKSTFIDQLRGHELPEEINGRLPAGIGDWPVVASSMKPVFPSGAPGVLLQYDMNGRGVSAGRDFCDDPALSGVVLANAVTVVNLRPPPDLIIDQLVAREGGGRTKEEILEETFTWRLRQSSYVVKHILRRWKPWIARKRLHSCRRKIDLYKQDGWLDELYERWQAYLRSLDTKGTTVEQIFLEPDLSTQTGNAYSWRIASAHQKTDTDPARGAEGHPTLDE